MLGRSGWFEFGVVGHRVRGVGEEGSEVKLDVMSGERDPEHERGGYVAGVGCERGGRYASMWEG